jgi:hypothetical protein
VTGVQVQHLFRRWKPAIWVSRWLRPRLGDRASSKQVGLLLSRTLIHRRFGLDFSAGLSHLTDDTGEGDAGAYAGAALRISPFYRSGFTSVLALRRTTGTFSRSSASASRRQTRPVARVGERDKRPRDISSPGPDSWPGARWRFLLHGLCCSSCWPCVSSRLRSGIRRSPASRKARQRREPADLGRTRSAPVLVPRLVNEYRTLYPR